MSLEFRVMKIIKQNNDTKDNNDIILRDVDTNIQNEAKETKNIIFKNKFLDTAFQSLVKRDRKIYLNIVYSNKFYPLTYEKGNF